MKNFKFDIIIIFGVLTSLGLSLDWSDFRDPGKLVSSAYTDFCSMMLSMNLIQSLKTPDINKMSLLLMTPCQNFSFPISKANEILKSEAFDPNKKVVVVVTGWLSSINDTGGPIYDISKAYFCRSDYNVIGLDANNYIDTVYAWSALNTDEIGLYLSKALVPLSDVIPAKNIHLIGHSLGAHIVGSAGRNFHKQTGKLISRITGLDPAKPCFKKNDQKMIGLHRGDAKFIDVIHTNAGVLGKSDPIGDIDFYSSGLKSLQPGCFAYDCAHDRAWEFYAESVFPNNENNFESVRCGSFNDLKKKNCSGKSEPMGFAVPTNAKGIRYLDVNGVKPFGKNNKNKNQEESAQCGLCSGPTKSLQKF